MSTPAVNSNTQTTVKEATDNIAKQHASRFAVKSVQTALKKATEARRA